VNSELFKFILSGWIVMGIILTVYFFEEFGWRCVLRALNAALDILLSVAVILFGLAFTIDLFR
jgi:hypothetical protein